MSWLRVQCDLQTVNCFFTCGNSATFPQGRLGLASWTDANRSVTVPKTPPRPKKRPTVQVSSKDYILKVMALTRFHFVAGMPHAGARHLTSVLSQNPRFAATQDSEAACVFSELHQLMATPGSAMNGLDPTTQVAILRAALDAAHHARPMDAVVLDQNPVWLRHINSLAQVLPLSRFIVMVRDPAAIAAVMAYESGSARSPRVLLGPDGAIGAPMTQIEAVMNSPAAERLLLIDYDRLLEDPQRVLGALYGVLREPFFEHDCRVLPQRENAAPKLQGLRRRVVSFTARAARKAPQQPKPLWQRSSGTAATLLLREAG